MTLLSIFIILAFFLFANLTTVIISKQKFGKCLPITLMITAFSLYFSQIIFKTFNIGFYFMIIYSMLSIFYIIYKRKDNKLLNIIKENYFTNAFYAFIMVIIIVSIFDLNRVYSHWDEYSHWGEMLKEMIRLDKFYSVSSSVLQAHKDYPPLLQLFELFIIKLCGEYKETFAIVAVHLLELSLFVSIIPESNNKRKTIVVGTIFSSLLIFLTTLFFDLHGIINSIYNDYFMAVLVAYSLISIFFFEDKKSLFSLINIGMSSTFLLLTKQIGISLYLMILFMYFGILFLEKDKQKKILTKSNIIIMLKICFIIIIIPILSWGYWNNYVKSINIDSQFNISDIEVTKLYKIYQGSYGRDDQKIAATKFIDFIEFENLTTSHIQLSYIQAIILGLFLIYILYSRNKKMFTKKKLYLLLLTLFIGAVGYAFVMWNTYIFCFKDIEAINLASFDRYMSTYILIILYCVIMLFIYSCIFNKNIKPLVYAAIVLFFLTNPAKISFIEPDLRKNEKQIFEIHADIIKKDIETNSKVFIVAEDSEGEYQYYVKYYANPIITNLRNFNWPVGENINYEEYYNSIKNYISEYDYLYIANTNNEFIEKYDFVFDEKIKNQQLYKIEKKENNEYDLVLIN